MKKKLLAGICAFALLVGTAAAVPGSFTNTGTVIGTSAETYGDYNYKVLYDGTAEISRYNGDAVNLKIPSKLDGRKVTSIGFRAFADCTSLKSVTIPKGVTNIGTWAFGSCTNLSSITFPTTITSVAVSAFSNTPWFDEQKKQGALLIINNILFDGQACSGNVVIPDGVKSIADQAFIDCKNITGVTIPDSVTSIGEMVFSGCSNLSSVTVSGSVTSIGYASFRECASLTDITLPGSLTTIAENAFSGCSSLKSIVIPGSVTKISNFAFSECTSLKSVTVPKSVAEIGTSAFGYYYESHKLTKVDGFKIFCYKNSAGLQYAKDNGFKYKVLNDPGDANGDGNVNMVDYALMQRYLASWKVDIDKVACDLNSDGTVNMQDYALFQRMLAG